MNYWREQLTNAPSTLELATDRVRPAVQSYRGWVQRKQLPLALSESLKELSRREEVTLFMTLLAAFEVLLYRYSGQGDFCVGTAVANRNRAEVEGLIGFFVNTLVLRADLSRDPSFRELLEQVRQVALDAYAHQDVPFERLVEELQPQRALSHSPLFQVMFVLQNTPVQVLQLRDLKFSAVDVWSRTAKFDLVLSSVATESGLVLSLEYNSDLFGAETIARMLEHYERLLAEVVVNVEERVSRMQLLSEAELEQVAAWNEMEREFPRESSIAEQFELQVAQRPEAEALVYEAERLSYRELNERANQLAHYLKEQGVGPEVVVGVSQERSVELIVSLLGILKAGGTYLPLDPEYPLGRREYMLQTAGAQLVLSEQEEDYGAGVQVINLAHELEPLRQRSKANPARQSGGDNLAYVMYTSGSTGKPKGVCVSQANVLRLVHEPEYVRLDQNTVMLQLTANTFDVATFEIWGALLRGGKLVLFPGRVASGEELQTLIGREGIETMWLTSAHYSGVAESGVEVLAGVKQLLIGGEALPVKPVREGVARLAETEFINGYGPTEVTAFSCSHRVQETVAEGWERGVPIGKPINNTESYVLDERGELLPVGVVGELYLGGAGLARGYVSDPAQTAERFVPHAYARGEGERLYRTGDLARWRADGALEYMGRVDEQVKLRGYRIEPGEIEQALREHEAVQDAVVVVRADEGEEKRLVAYVVAAAEAVSVSELRQHLRERLPEYMVPWNYELLERLPLNTSGKVDRDALPAPSSSPEGAGEYAPPRTATEEILANIWSQVLGVRRVVINDNFFQLGGHSLTAMQIVSRVRKTFQVELPLRDFFESATISQLAQRVESARQTGGIQHTPLLPISRDQALPLSFGQQRFWFLNQLQSDNSPYNLAAAVRLSGSLNVNALEQTFTEIIRRHEILRTTFNEIDGQAAQIISPPQPVKLFIDDLSELPETQRDRVLKRRLNESANQRFDLTTGPLFKPELIALGPNDHVLLLTMHHIISDGWSIQIFVRELVALYDANVNQKLMALPDLPIQYADFAHWQRALVEGPEQEVQLNYWRGRLGGDLPVLNLPADRPRPAVPTYRGVTEQFVLAPELIEPLRALSQREGVTLFMALLAVWQTLLHRYTGQEDVVNGTVISNRNRPELEGLIGFFVNTLVLRTDFSGNPTYLELLHRVRDVCFGAYSNQDLPFERLVEVLRPQRRANDVPLFQVMFNLQTTSHSSVELSGLTLSMMDLDIETAPFDITLSLVDATQGGLGGIIRYSTDLFDALTIQRMITHFRTLLGSIAADPETRLSELEIYTETEKQQQATEKAQRKDSKLRKLRDVKLKSVELSAQNLIDTEYFSEAKLPLIVQPKVDGINLVTWAGANRDFIEQQILQHGSLLFRNFGLDSLTRFEQFASALSPNLLAYGERSSPRTGLGGHVYTSTTHPADQCIHMHNENSYTLRWPMKLWFFCVQPAEQGGRTPIADSRRVLHRIDPSIVNKFIEKKILYVRNYGDGLGLPWQEVFQTFDRTAVEEYCGRNGIQVQWKNGDRLRTSQVRPAVRRHTKSGALVWFNHAAFFHISNLDEATRRSTLEMMKEDEVPFNTFYGDGSPIELSVLENIRAAYEQESVSFAWEKGDVLMLDNMLVSHGRESFTGPRQIVFIMADQIESPDETEIHQSL